MDHRTRLGLEVLGAALVLGLLGDLWLRAAPWGGNALLWTACLAATGWGLATRWRSTLAGTERWLLLPIAAFALLYVGRDAALLKLANTMAIGAAFGLGMQQVRARRTDPLDEPPGLLATGVRALGALPHFLVREVDWTSLRSQERRRITTGVLRGLVLALPVVLVFGTLLASADAAFEALVGRLLSVEVAQLPAHLLATALLAWLAGAILFGLLAPPTTANDRARDTAVREWRVRLGIVETAVVLGLVNALFAVFVALQVPYLFGGMHTVLGTPDLTLAQYARRGFFELAAVAAMGLPLLLGLRRLLDARTVRSRWLFRGLAGAQVGLLVLILVSAAQRMWLYQDAYGLTMLRLYVSACIVWMGFVLVWFAGSMLRGRAERFVPGAVLAGFAVVLALHVVNPGALIVRVNAARATDERPFDAVYATGLSADAVPTLLDVLPRLDPGARAYVARCLLDRWLLDADDDWRTWSRSRAAARRAVTTRAATLFQMAHGAPRSRAPAG